MSLFNNEKKNNKQRNCIEFIVSIFKIIHLNKINE